jgi:putative transposase
MEKKEGSSMQLTEQHVIDRKDPRFATIDAAAFKSKNLYNAALYGIRVEVTEESYTSKASFLDLDEIPVYDPDNKEQHVFSGKRIGPRQRLYRTKDGRIICADVNGAYNILRKRRPGAFLKAKGVAGYVVHPVRLAV